MKKLTITIMMIIMMSSITFGIVTRTISGSDITYQAEQSIWASAYIKSYWAVEDTYSGGCTIDTVNPTSCGTDCEYSVLGNTVRIVVFPPNDASYNLPSSAVISLTGTGVCDTAVGNSVETYPGNEGGSSGIGGLPNLNLVESCAYESDIPPVCNGIDWTEFKNYLLDWAGNLGGYGHTLTWDDLRTNLLEWATGG